MCLWVDVSAEESSLDLRDCERVEVELKKLVVTSSCALLPLFMKREREKRVGSKILNNMTVRGRTGVM